MNEYIDRVIKRLRMGWTKGAFVRLPNGSPDCDLEDGCCWCFSGAMLVEDDRNYVFYPKLRRLMIDKLPETADIFYYNDTQETVDSIIQLLESVKQS